MKGFGNKDERIKKKKKFFSKDKIVTNALNLHVKGEIAEAKKLYESFISQGFEDPKVFANYGAILQDMGNMKDAEIFARKAIKLAPNFLNAYSNLAKIFEDTHKLHEAETVFKKITEINPNSYKSYFDYGSILENTGKNKEAQDAYTKALQLNPESAEIHHKFSLCLIKTDDLEKAAHHSKKAIEINKNFYQAYLQLGAILRAQLKFKESIKIFTEAIKMEPLLHLGYFNLGRTYDLMGDYPNAELNLIKAIEIKQDCFDSYFQLSVSLRSQGKFEQARVCDEQLISIRPWSIVGSYNFNREKK